MGGLPILLALSVVMALASFLAGALPLSMTLSQSQLRLISSIGIGILVGTSLIVIIPEGIEAVVTTSGSPAQPHQPRHAHILWNRDGLGLDQEEELVGLARQRRSLVEPGERLEQWIDARTREKDDSRPPEETQANGEATASPTLPERVKEAHEKAKLPTFYIGFALAIGFVLMFLIDRLPRHASENFQAAPTTRHISLDDLASTTAPIEEEAAGFLGSLAPTPKQSRSLAATTGLVIHAAADGIAMGASATTADMKLGFIIFAAIMIHKAPAAFGLTSVLLKQGLSKRAARGHLIVFSLAAPFGALSTYLIISLLGGSNMDGPSGQEWTGMLLLFSAGTFLYVAMHAHAQQEDGGSASLEHAAMNGYTEGNNFNQRKQAKPQMRDTLATVAGMLFPLLIQFGYHH